MERTRFISIEGLVNSVIRSCVLPLIAVVALLGAPHEALAQRTGIWNQDTGEVEYPAGNVIGVVANGVAVSTVDPQGVLLSQPPFSLEFVVGTRDGITYALTPDGRLVPVDDEEEEEEGNIGIIGSLGNAGSTGNSGGNNGGNSGGNNGGNSGGNSGGNNGGSTGGSNGTPNQNAGDIEAGNNPYDEGSAGEGGDQRSFPQQRSYEQIANGQKLHNKLPVTFEGYSSQWQGFHRNLLIPERDAKYAYPDLAATKGGGGSTPRVANPKSQAGRDVASSVSATAGGDERPEMSKLFDYSQNRKQLPRPQEIGVDDEILKTSMAIYQPIARMQMDFLEDEYLRDRYLESGQTLRGVAIMTMGFLDKTVGAGLTAVQQQADQNTIQNLLKQVSWTTHKLANYDHAQVYKDMDEKVESCLEIALSKKSAKQNVKGQILERVEFQCSQTCGKEPKGTKDYRTANGEKSGNGSYGYCVCCAEADTKLNKLSEKGRQPVALEGVEDPTRVWTLAERAWLGVGKDGAKVLKDNLEAYKQIYGDVVLTTEGASGGGGSKEPYLSYVYQMPQVSPTLLVAMYANKCHYNKDLQESIGEEGNCEELANQFKVKYGVCPALFKIFENWEDIIQGGSAGGQLGEWWAEASMGHPLDGRIIKQMLAINGDPVTKLAPGEEKATLSRVIESFCETSAVAALVRLHSKYSAMLSDHLTLSRQMNSSEKQLLQSLTGRFGQYLALAEADTNSKYKAEAALSGLSIQFDRRNTGLLASTSQANLNWQNYIAQASGYTAIGRASEYCDGGNCEGSGSSSTGGRAAPAGGLDRAQFDPFAKLNATKDQNDPVNKKLNALAEEMTGVSSQR